MPSKQIVSVRLAVAVARDLFHDGPPDGQDRAELTSAIIDHLYETWNSDGSLFYAVPDSGCLQPCCLVLPRRDAHAPA